MDSNSRPRQLFFYRPHMVRLPPLERIGPQGPLRIEPQVKIFSIGGISITVRVPFDVGSITELVDYHDIVFTNGMSLHDEVLSLAEEIRRELAPYLVRPVERLAPEEAYTVFCITSPLNTAAGAHVATEDWLDANRRQVAALLTEERDISHLSEQEADETTSRYLSYYDHDMVVVDWDAALIIDENRYIDEMVYLMELANLQLAELEAYDRLLDGVIDRSYRDVSASGNLQGMRRWTGRKTLNDLRELRIDLARLSDELLQHHQVLRRLAPAASTRPLPVSFHLALTGTRPPTKSSAKTLDDLYQLLQADRNNRYMLILEITIV